MDENKNNCEDFWYVNENELGNLFELYNTNKFTPDENEYLKKTQELLEYQYFTNWFRYSVKSHPFSRGLKKSNVEYRFFFYSVSLKLELMEEWINYQSKLHLYTQHRLFIGCNKNR